MRQPLCAAFGLRTRIVIATGRAGALAEYVIAFARASAGPDVRCVAAQVQHVDCAEFLGEAGAQAGVGVAVDPRSVGDEGDDAFRADAVGRPADRHLVGIVEAVFQGRGGARGVCFGHAPLERGVVDVGVFVGGAALARGPGRVADDDLDGGFLLAFDAVAVAGEPDLRQRAAALAQGEGVGQGDAGERFVSAFAAAAPVERLLDMDGGDVVGEQYDFVGVELARVFPRQVGSGDQARLQEPRGEDAGAGERVEDMHVFIGEAAAEFIAQGAVGAVQDEVHDLDGGIDDAEAVGVLFHRAGEKALVELHQDALARGAVAEAAGAEPHAFVEAPEVAGFVLEAELAEIAAQFVEGLRHGVAAREVVSLEQRLEYGPRDDVLRHHVDGGGAGYRIVDGGSQFLVEGAEPLAEGFVSGAGEQALDAHDEAGEDIGHVGGPAFPVAAVAAFLDDFGEDGLRRQVEGREREARGAALAAGAIFVSAVAAAGEDDALGRLPVEVDAGDFGVEAFVVGTQGVEYAPYGGETLVPVEGLPRVVGGGHGDGQDDIAVFLAGRGAHDAPDGLYDVDLGVARAHEEHGVEGRRVDALGEAAGVGQDAAGAGGALLEPFDGGGAVERAGLAIDMAGFATQRAGAPGRGQALDGALDNAGPMRGQAPGGGDGVGKGDCAREGAGRAGGAAAAAAVFGVAQGAPAADDFRGVGNVDFAAARGEVRLQRGVGGALGKGEDDHLVIGEQAARDGAGEGQAVEFGPVGLRVVHREDLGVAARGPGLCAGGVEARRGGHVEALAGADARGVVDQDEMRRAVAGALDAGGAVGLVAKDEVERRRAVGLRALDEAERMVGAEHGGHRARALGAEGAGNLRRIGGDGDFELLQPRVLALASAPGAFVGTHADVAVRKGALRGPFAHRLREQRDRGHEIERAPADAGDGLGNAQRDVGLARAARHDELAAVVLREAREGVVERLLLVRARGEFRAAPGEVFRAAADEVGPAEGAAREVAGAQHLTARVQAADGFPGVGAPFVRCVDEYAGGEGVAIRGGDERIDVGFGYGRTGRVAFALHGAYAAAALLGDDVDAGVAAVETRPPRGPFAPQGDAREAVGIEGVELEPALDEAFEQAALGGLGAGGRADVGERGVEAGGHGAAPPSPNRGAAGLGFAGLRGGGMCFFPVGAGSMGVGDGAFLVHSGAAVNAGGSTIAGAGGRGRSRLSGSVARCGNVRAGHCGDPRGSGPAAVRVVMPAAVVVGLFARGATPPKAGLGCAGVSPARLQPTANAAKSGRGRLAPHPADAAPCGNVRAGTPAHPGPACAGVASCASRRRANTRGVRLAGTCVRMPAGHGLRLGCAVASCASRRRC